MKMEKHPTLNYCIVLCGIAGSGKTTLSHNLADEYDAKLYSYDDLLYCSSMNKLELRTWILSSIVKDLQAGINIVLDDVNILIKSRIEVLEAIKEYECKKKLIVMNTSLEDCLLRNANRKKRLPDWVIKHMYRKYQVPTFDEGWDEILYY